MLTVKVAKEQVLILVTDNEGNDQRTIFLLDQKSIQDFRIRLYNLNAEIVAGLKGKQIHKTMAVVDKTMLQVQGDGKGLEVILESPNRHSVLDFTRCSVDINQLLSLETALDLVLDTDAYQKIFVDRYGIREIARVID